MKLPRYGKNSNPAHKMIVQSRMESDGTGVLTVVVNTLTSVNAPEFRIAAEQMIANSSGQVLVDCSQVEFLDSSGVGAFLHAHNLLAEKRRPVRLLGVGSRLLAILELMQVHRIFDLDIRK
jgi:anti-sigma B factor antagonist